MLGIAQPFSFLASTLRYSARSFARTPLITGIVLAVGVKYLLERFAPATPTTLETWAAGPALLLAVVVVASAIPALRALAVSPVRVLRDDG